MKRRPRRHVDQDRRSCRDHRVDRGGGDIPDESQLCGRLSVLAVGECVDIHAALVRAPDKGRQRRFGYAAADCIRECHLSNRSFQIRSDTDFVLHQYTNLF